MHDRRHPVLTLAVAALTLVAFGACESPVDPVTETGEMPAPQFSSHHVVYGDFPSTNDDNRDDGFPHVNELGKDIGEVTLEFVNNTNSLAFFEYRIDGQVLTSGTDHPVVNGSYIYPGVCVDGRSPPECGDGSPEVMTFSADEYVEVRLALGGERDWDFDWTTFDVVPDVQTKDECKHGGWEMFGFRNQGQCVRFIETGKDSRE